MFSEDKYLQNNDTCSTLELWTQIKREQQSFSNNSRSFLNMVDLVETIQLGWRNAATENAQYKERNQRLIRENENYVHEMKKLKEENQQLCYKQAVDQAFIKDLQNELAIYKARFNAARAEIHNAPALGLPSVHEVNIPYIDDQSTDGGQESEDREQQQGAKSRRKRRSNSAVATISANSKRAKPLSDENTQDELDSSSTISVSWCRQNFGSSTETSIAFAAGKQQICTSTLLPPLKLTNSAQGNGGLLLGPAFTCSSLVPPPKKWTANAIDNESQTPLTSRKQRGMPAPIRIGRTPEVRGQTGRKRRSTSAPHGGMNVIHNYTPMSLVAKNKRIAADGFGNGWTRGRPVDQCGHNFVAAPFTAILRSRGPSCVACNSMIWPNKPSLKCTVCNFHVHDQCRLKVPFLCVPIISTARWLNASQRVPLSEICASTRPQIPGQLIHCVLAIEQRIGENGLYKVPFMDNREYKKLTACFNLKFPPRMGKFDSVTITGFIKKFLTDLRDPLIPYSSFKEFHKAVNSLDVSNLKFAIETLPFPNLDTLAFLFAHWQKVVMHSKAPLDGLARVLGPIIACPLANTSETDKTAAVEIFIGLLKLEQAYWTKFFNPPPVIATSQSGERDNQFCVPLLSFTPLVSSSAVRPIKATPHTTANNATTIPPASTNSAQPNPAPDVGQQPLSANQSRSSYLGPLYIDGNAWKNGAVQEGGPLVQRYPRSAVAPSLGKIY